MFGGYSSLLNSPASSAQFEVYYNPKILKSIFQEGIWMNFAVSLSDVTRPFIYLFLELNSSSHVAFTVQHPPIT